MTTIVERDGCVLALLAKHAGREEGLSVGIFVCLTSGCWRQAEPVFVMGAS